ncbi:claudin-5 precursor, partial [Triplophysa rosa]
SNIIPLVIVPVRRCSFAGRIFHRVPGVSRSRTRAAEHAASDQQHRGGRPADVERRADLSFLGGRHLRIVEVGDDVVGHPAQGHQHEDGTDDVDRPSDVHHARLHAIRLDAVGTLRSGDHHHQPDYAHHGRDDRERAGGLEVVVESEHRVVHLALHLAGALHGARHPQAVPDGLGHHDVGLDEGGHLPGGQPASGHFQKRAENAQGQTKDLQCRGG